MYVITPVANGYIVAVKTKNISKELIAQDINEVVYMLRELESKEKIKDKIEKTTANKEVLKDDDKSE